MSMLTLRFKGMCCFVDGRAGDAFAKRVVLPRDMRALDRKESHVPYIEFEADDVYVNGDKSAAKADKRYHRGEGILGRSYVRFELDGERVLIRNAAKGPGQLVVVPTFDERVPKMTLVCPECPPNPRADCFAPQPPDDIVAAYFDIGTGYLNAGPLEHEETTFDEGSEWPPRRLAQWAQLDLPIHGDRAEIVIEKYDGSGIRTVALKRGAASITIGNGRTEEIEETAVDSHHRDHFDEYYKLGETMPKRRPKPMTPKSAIRACSPTNWP